MREFACKLCDGVSDANEWNESTREVYSEDIYEIDDIKRLGHACYFVCPKCKSDCDENELLEKV